MLDLANPIDPKQVGAFPFNLGYERSGVLVGDDLYMTFKNGLAVLDHDKGLPRPIATILNDEFFDSYPTDLLAGSDFLYVSGLHAGLHIYSIQSPGKLDLVRSIKKGYTPTHLQWWEQDEILLMVGNEDIIAVDTSTPQKASQKKSCKLKDIKLAPALAREGSQGLVVGYGLKTNRNTIRIATIDMSVPLEPKVISKTELAVEERADSITGLVLHEEYALVSGFYLKLKVLEGR